MEVVIFYGMNIVILVIFITCILSFFYFYDIDGTILKSQKKQSYVKVRNKEIYSIKLLMKKQVLIRTQTFVMCVCTFIITEKDILSIDEEAATEQLATTIYQPYWMIDNNDCSCSYLFVRLSSDFLSFAFMNVVILV